MSKQGPNPLDVEVGRRIRFRRCAAKLSQSELGNKIGVTFQQVQKYEKGSNRVGASRLANIAEVLNVPVAAFFEDVQDPGKRSAGPSPVEMLYQPRAFRLLKAFNSLENAMVQSAIIELVEAIQSTALEPALLAPNIPTDTA